MRAADQVNDTGDVAQVDVAWILKDLKNTIRSFASREFQEVNIGVSALRLSVLHANSLFRSDSFFR